MLKLLFDNTPSIDERARTAVRRIMERAEDYPDWPKFDLAWEREQCYQCGEPHWHLAGRSLECESCRRERAEREQIEHELRLFDLERKRTDLDLRRS